MVVPIMATPIRLVVQSGFPANVGQAMFSVGGKVIEQAIIKPKYVTMFVNTVGATARAAGIPKSAIKVTKLAKTKKFAATQMIDITTTPKKAAIAATAVTAGIATAYDAMAKDIKRAVTRKKKIVHKRKYTLTKKQAAKLKKDGYVYITRNKKQVKITR